MLSRRTRTARIANQRKPSPAACAGRAVLSSRSCRDVFVALVAGLALGASFIDFRLFVLPWVALVPLIALAEAHPPRQSFGLGCASGTAGIALAFSWLIHTFRIFGGFSATTAFAVFVVPVAWMALQFGLFTGLIAWIGPLPLGLTAPLVFTAIEFLFPSPFPWRLAHSQYRTPMLLQTAELAGPFLLSFAMVWTSAGLLAALRSATARGNTPDPHASRRAQRATILAPAALLIILSAYGSWRLAAVRTAREHAPALRIGVVQGNIGVTRKGDRSFFAHNIEDYRALSRAVAADVDLLVWPETVVQRHLPIDRSWLDVAENPFPGVPRPLVFGGLGIDDRQGDPRLFNSAFLLREDGTIAGRYDKRVLVPFGEYLPLAKRWPQLRRLSPATGNFTAGTAVTLLAVSPTARVAPLICYEDVIPGPARDAVSSGATLLLNLTNDAWYGDSAEPVQHQALAVWRAVENRRDLLRSTNTGLTSVISATGEVLGELPIFEAATLVAEARLLTSATVYGAVGDVFAWVVVAALVAVVLQRYHARTAPPSAQRWPTK